MESSSTESTNGEGRSPAIIVTVEGLGTNLIGCYGNALVPTPAWDQFAARAIVADQFWMDSIHATDILKSMWSGQHHLQRNASATPRNVTIDWQVPGLFVTDNPEVAAAARESLPGLALVVDPREAESQFAFLLETALTRWLESMDNWPWLWIHSRGLLGPWDAPYEYRKLMCDDEDPDPPKECEPPHLQLPTDADPDIAFGCACGAGGQAVAMNEGWELLETFLQQTALSSECLVVLAGVLGFPLGEHGLVGWPNDESLTRPASRLHAEQLHSPLMIRPGCALPIGVRYAPFLQPHHVKGLIHAWFDIEGKSGDSPWDISVDKLFQFSGARREHWPRKLCAAFAVADGEEAVMLPSWSAHWALTSDLRSNERLYAMPDDRWQQNEIASRAPDVLERMQQLAAQWKQHMRSLSCSTSEPNNHPLEDIDEILWRPTR